MRSCSSGCCPSSSTSSPARAASRSPPPARRTERQRPTGLPGLRVHILTDRSNRTSAGCGSCCPGVQELFRCDRFKLVLVRAEFLVRKEAVVVIHVFPRVPVSVPALFDLDLLHYDKLTVRWHHLEEPAVSFVVSTPVVESLWCLGVQHTEVLCGLSSNLPKIFHRTILSAGSYRTLHRRRRLEGSALPGCGRSLVSTARGRGVAGVSPAGGCRTCGRPLAHNAATPAICRAVSATQSESPPQTHCRGGESCRGGSPVRRRRRRHGAPPSPDVRTEPSLQRRAA